MSCSFYNIVVLVASVFFCNVSVVHRSIPINKDETIDGGNINKYINIYIYIVDVDLLKIKKWTILQYRCLIQQQNYYSHL
jgi:hypothetical protein